MLQLRKASFFAAIQGFLRTAWRSLTFAVLVSVGMANLAADDPDVASPLVSYVFLDSLEEPPPDPNIVSPLVSYLFHDWIGDENVTFTFSGTVSYLKEGGVAAPNVTGISPRSIPGIEGRQWVTVLGTDFAAGAQVYLFDGVSSFLIPPDRVILRSDSEIGIFVNFTTNPAQWTVQVVNPGGFASTPLAFQVNTPMVRPLDAMDFGTVRLGEQSERTFIVRNNGTSTATFSASLTDLFGPFEFAGGGFGDLAPGAEQAVLLRYSPNLPVSHESSVIFRLGGESVVRSLTGRAVEAVAGEFGSITGKVVRQLEGNLVPVQGASVSLLRLVNGKRAITGHSARTGPGGEFSFNHVNPESYFLEADPPERLRFMVRSSKPISVSAGESVEHDLLMVAAQVQSSRNPYEIPIVLVRGRGVANVVANEVQYWDALRRRLRPDFHHVWDPNESGESFINGEEGIQANADRLLDYIEQQSAYYERDLGAPPRRVHLVAHSMGGLIVRQMLQNDSTRRRLPPIGDVFMLSTPNAGSVLADGGASVGTFAYTARLGALVDKWWRFDWQTNWDLRTSHIRKNFAPQVHWPGPSAGIRLFIAGGTSMGNPLAYPEYALTYPLIASASPNDSANDGAVTLLSSRGDYYPFLSFTRRSSFHDASPHIPPRTALLNHTEIKQDDVVLEWIDGILRGRSPAPIAPSESEPLAAPQEEPVQISQSMDVTLAEQDSSVLIDLRTFTVSAGDTIIHEVPVETGPQVDFTVSYSDPAVSVRLIEPGGRTINAATSAGDPAISFETLDGEDGGVVIVSVSDPVPGLWRVEGNAVNSVAEVALTSQVSGQSSLQMAPFIPERVGSSAPVTMLAKMFMAAGDEITPVPGAAVTVSMIAPDGQVSNLPLVDDGTQGDDGANDGTHGFIVTEPGGSGDYEHLFRADGVHPVTGEAFRRFAQGDFTRASPGGFVAEILSHTAVDSDDNGYLDSVMLEVRVEVAAAGDYALSGRLLSEGYQEEITAVADFSPTGGGTAAVTLLFTPHELPEDKDIGPFALEDLLLFRRGQDTTFLDMFAGDYEVPVTLHNEVSRVIREMSPESLKFEVAVG